MYPESTRNFESNKTLGGVGALLTAIGSFVPVAGPVGIVSIVGIILVLISMRGLADDLKEPGIWKNALNGFIFGIVAIGAAIVVFVAVFFAIFSATRFMAPLGLGPGIAGAIIGLIIVFIFFLLEAIYYRHAFDILGQKTGERMFHTGGLLLFIGAILTIVLVGFILLFVAWILLAVGFFSMRPPTTQAAPAYAAPSSAVATTTPPSGQVKYCPYCGAENKLDGTFCMHCGRRIATP